MKQISILAALFFFAAIQFSCSKTGDGLSGSTGGIRLDVGSGTGSSGGWGGSLPAGVITAGEWDDLNNWDFWKNIIQKDTFNTYPGLWGFFTDSRISIVLKDNKGRLIHDAKLTISNGAYNASSVTDNFGKAELFPGLFASTVTPTIYDLKASYNGQQFNLGSISPSPTPITKTIPISKTVANTLDIAFVVDATGSMGDELEYLKKEIKDVINRAGGQLPGVQIRMASLYYKDEGDAYVTRPFNFTTDVNQLSAFISNQQAGGGGDFPEAVDQALHETINQLQWSSKAVNRLVFLVLDAPPHKDPAKLNKLRNAISAAQQKGIRIIPVSASGIDKETEFLLRFLSIGTNSTYVFITNHSGIGNPHITATVGQYEVEYLNNLMVRLITKYGKNVD